MEALTGLIVIWLILMNIARFGMFLHPDSELMKYTRRAWNPSQRILAAVLWLPILGDVAFLFLIIRLVFSWIFENSSKKREERGSSSREGDVWE